MSGENERDDGEQGVRVKCYLCGEFRPKSDTELNPYRVDSWGHGGSIRVVVRYVRMCRFGHGRKA